MLQANVGLTVTARVGSRLFDHACRKVCSVSTAQREDQQSRGALNRDAASSSTLQINHFWGPRGNPYNLAAAGHRREPGSQLITAAKSSVDLA
jgi:hypothetical protein